MTKRYVLGFAFTENRQEVLLIRKARSSTGDWMIGRHNGLGGMIIERENPFVAMSREFCEECGITIDPYDWQWCGKFGRQDDYEVIVFRIFNDAVRKYSTCSTEGEIFLIRVSDIPFIPHVKNLLWLAPMLLKSDLTTFVVEE